MMSNWEQQGIPNPGSSSAIARGCACPRMDNRYGRGVTVAHDLCFYVAAGCPVHAPIVDTAPL